MRYKVYLAKLKRIIGSPRCVYKIGITSSFDAMDRINYRGPDEPYPITDYFFDNKIMHSIVVDSECKARSIEASIMEAIKGNERYFHNWFEKDPISGITEMRKWNYHEVQTCIRLMNEAVN